MIKLFEKFVEQDYLDFTKKEQLKLINRFGNKNVEKFATEGDIDGLKFLLKNGYDINEVDSENLLTLALNNDKMETFDFLIKIGYGQGPNGYENSVDCITLPDIIGRRDENPNITKEQVEKLKIISKYGYDFNMGGSYKYNLIELYLCKHEYNNETSGYDILLVNGVEPFIDWLLNNYPQKYQLLKNIKLPKSITKKYADLIKSDKYNL